MVQANPRGMVEVHPHTVAFLQRKWVQNGLPILTSLAFHAGLVLFAISVYRVATGGGFTTEIQNQPVFGDYPETVNTTPGGTGLTGQIRETRLGNTEIPEVESVVFNKNKALSLGAAVESGNSDTANDTSTLGIGPTRGIPGIPGQIGGLGGTGNDIGEVANIRIGRPDGTGDGTGNGSFPKKVLSPRVVFVCDATGSMQSIFGGLKTELQECINHLEMPQAFNVIFFSDDKVLAANKDGLMFANSDNKRKLAGFLSDIAPHGQTNPLPAIRAAFAQKPESIYVLTDGFDQVDSLESVYNEFATLNKDGKTRVNTILIGNPDQKELVDLLKRIAKDNRGTMRIVSREAF